MTSKTPNTPDDQTGAARRAAPGVAQLPVWKKVVFAALVGVAFFAVVEALLWAFGVKPLLYEDDPYVGFESRVPLFAESGGRLQTAANKVRWFNEQSFPADKPSGTTRIFCVGGSTTYGRPFRDATSFCGWLREYLPAADPGRRWEVVNAGGISYASYRIAALMEELAHYQPDLFIIYCGHNEFLERRTYGELMDMPPAVRGLQATLSKSRTYSALARVVRGGPSAGDSTELRAEVDTILDNSVGPEDYQRDPAWRDQVISHYRFNLARMVDIARAAGAEVVFVMPASNLRNCSPFKSENDQRLEVADHRRWQQSFDAARAAHAAGDHAQALEAIREAATLDPRHAHTRYLHAQVLDSLGRPGEAAPEYAAALEEDVCPLRMLAAMREPLREVAADRGVALVDFLAQAEARAPDGIPGDDQFLDHVHPTIESHRLLALALLDELARRGTATVAGGWDEAGARARVMARVDDNERGIAMRNLANVLQWAGKYEDAFRAASRALALAPGDAYANFVAGDLALKLGRGDEALERFTFLAGFDLDSEDAPYFADAHYKLARLLAERGDHAGSVRMLRRTLELRPAHDGAPQALRAQLQGWGTALLQAGEGAAALAPLRQLYELDPSAADARNLLGIALIQAGQPREAIPHLEAVLAGGARNPAVHNNLATAYAQVGERARAVTHFKATVELEPGHLGATMNLGELYLESGEAGLAARQFARVLELHPDHAAARARLQQIEAAGRPR